jgi:glycosyltransferase involved in cell wall biosynthesis
MAHFIQAVTVPWYNACADYAVMLARGLRDLGHRVSFAGGPGSPAVERARELGFETIGGSGPASKNPLDLIRLARVYRTFALSHEAAVVNVHHGRDHLAWAAALRGTGIPLVRTSGSQIPPNVHPGARYLLRRRTAGIIATCGTIRGYYTAGFLIDPSSIPVINGGVDAEFFSPSHPRGTMRESLGIPARSFVFAVIGRFSPVKGHRYFFEAAGEVHRSFPEAWFVAAGWDAQLTLGDMRAMAERAGIIERTRFIGRQKDIRDLLGSVDAGVIASVGSETVCRIALEYQAMGIPVIAAGTNVIPEIVLDGVGGCIVPPGNARAMEDAMLRFAAAPGQAAEWGRRGRERIEREFSLARFAVKTLDAYRSFGVNV